jgi:trans-aconitate 2-methyltransferase
MSLRVSVKNLDIEISRADDRRMPWSPERYLTYADERGRPFLDLLTRVPAQAPRSVVDLGCGPGNLTTLLKRRWPNADVLGLDSSPEMIAAALSSDGDGVRYEVGDIATWRPEEPPDVVVSNAALQWVPGHLELLPRLASYARTCFAFQVPGNFDSPSHTIRRELAADSRFSPYVQGVEHPDAESAEVYLDVLQREGYRVDAWETTYLHVLQGQDAVFDWVAATGARPTIEALPDGLREEFVAELKPRLREAYPPGRHGTVLPFRRVFVVASTEPVSR